MTNENWPKPSDLNRVIAKLNSDHAFKAQLLSNANSALTGIGVEVPKGLTIKVHENTASTLHFILPPRTADGELSDSVLEAVAGGSGHPHADKGAG